GWVSGRGNSFQLVTAVEDQVATCVSNGERPSAVRVNLVQIAVAIQVSIDRTDRKTAEIVGALQIGAVRKSDRVERAGAQAHVFAEARPFARVTFIGHDQISRSAKIVSVNRVRTVNALKWPRPNIDGVVLVARIESCPRLIVVLEPKRENVGHDRIGDVHDGQRVVFLQSDPCSRGISRNRDILWFEVLRGSGIWAINTNAGRQVATIERAKIGRSDGRIDGAG